MLFLVVSFFFNDTATTEIYTLSLHDALPIFFMERIWGGRKLAQLFRKNLPPKKPIGESWEVVRSEEHTSELQSHSDLVCRLLLEKKNIRVQRTATVASSHRPHRECTD